MSIIKYNLSRLIKKERETHNVLPSLFKIEYRIYILTLNQLATA